MKPNRRNDLEQTLRFYSFAMNGQQPQQQKKIIEEIAPNLERQLHEREEKKKTNKKYNGTADVEKSIWIDYIGNEWP